MKGTTEEIMRKTMLHVCLVIGLLSVLLLLQFWYVGQAGKVQAQRADPEPGGCTNATLQGTYGAYRLGANLNGPLAAVGIVTYDGIGFASIRQSINRQTPTHTGEFIRNVVIPGTYQVNSDCTGDAFADDGSLLVTFVIVDGGREVYKIGGTPGNAIIEVAKKIAPAHDRDDDDRRPPVFCQ